jgi:LysR family transcriptional regulator, cell division regulator
MIAAPADLAYFIEVAGTLNVSRAAERLGISQPSLSLAMRRLETAVGAQLLIRSKRGVGLTQAGRQLLNHARLLLQSWENIRAGALASVHGIEGTYTIGCHPSVGLYLLSHVLPELIEKHPKLDIRLRHDLSRKIAEEVVTMKVDVGIVVNPVRHPDLVIHRLCEDEVTLWAAKGSRRNRSVLICDPDLAQSRSLLKRFEKAGLHFERTIHSGSLEVIADLVSGGCGVGILPARVAALARRKLERLSPAPVFKDEHCLIYRVENKGVKSIQALGGAIKDFFAAHA